VHKRTIHPGGKGASPAGFATTHTKEQIENHTAKATTQENDGTNHQMSSKAGIQ
jgi:hypothetical protein